MSKVKSQIVLVTQLGCPPCDEAKLILNKWEVEYSVVVKGSSEFIEIDNKYSINRFPTLLIYCTVQGQDELKRPRQVELIWRGSLDPQEKVQAFLTALSS